MRGFDESFAFAAGEDVDLGLRLTAAGHQLRINPQAVVWHVGYTSLSKVLVRSFIRGRGNGTLMIEHPALFAGPPSHGLRLLVKRLLNDVKNIFKKDVLHRMRNRVYSTANPAETRDPGFWDKTMSGVSKALDATENVMVNMIKKPLVTGTRTTLKAGSSVLFYGRDAAAKSGRGVWNGVRFTGRKIKDGASAVGRLFRRKK